MYKNRDLRKASVKKIIELMKCEGVNVDKDGVKKKIGNLRTQFRRELAKATSKKSGMSADDVYTPTLWCFNELQFLRDGDEPAPSVSNLEATPSCSSTLLPNLEVCQSAEFRRLEQEIDEEIPEILAEEGITLVSGSPSQGPKKKRKRRASSPQASDRLLNEAIKSLKSINSQDNICPFGMLVSNELRQMNEQNRMAARKIMYDAIHYRRLGILDLNCKILRQINDEATEVMDS